MLQQTTEYVCIIYPISLCAVSTRSPSSSDPIAIREDCVIYGVVDIQIVPRVVCTIKQMRNGQRLRGEKKRGSC